MVLSGLHFLDNALHTFGCAVKSHGGCAKVVGCIFKRRGNRQLVLCADGNDLRHEGRDLFVVDFL